MVQPSITMLYPQTSPPPLAQEPQAPAHCLTVGNQLKSHFFAKQMGQSHAPSPCRPHGHPPQNQRIPLLCVTDHSSGHTQKSGSPYPKLEGPHQSVGTLCPARARRANVLSYRGHRTPPAQALTPRTYPASHGRRAAAPSPRAPPAPLSR